MAAAANDIPANFCAIFFSVWLLAVCIALENNLSASSAVAAGQVVPKLKVVRGELHVATAQRPAIFVKVPLPRIEDEPPTFASVFRRQIMRLAHRLTPFLSWLLWWDEIEKLFEEQP